MDWGCRRMDAFEWAEFFAQAAKRFHCVRLGAQLEDKLLGCLRAFFCCNPHERYFLCGEHRDENRLVGKAVIERPWHWVAILSDSCGDQKPATSELEYFLRSELLACILLLRHQMNRIIWRNPRTGPQLKFVRWELEVKDDRPVKATVVTFSSTRVRVVQAACVPSSPSQSVALTVRTCLVIGDGLTGYDPDVARKVLRWIICPDEPFLPPSAAYCGTVTTEVEPALGRRAGGPPCA